MPDDSFFCYTVRFMIYVICPSLISAGERANRVQATLLPLRNKHSSALQQRTESVLHVRSRCKFVFESGSERAATRPVVLVGELESTGAEEAQRCSKNMIS